ARRRGGGCEVPTGCMRAGTSSLRGDGVLAAPRRVRPRRRHGGRPQLLRRLRGPARRPRPHTRNTAPERRLHDGDLPVITAHIGGIPVEESLPQLAPAGAVILTAFP